MDSRNKEILALSGFDPSFRDKYINMSINEKRKLFKCGDSFVTLDTIPNVKTQYVTYNKKFNKSSENIEDVSELKHNDAHFLAEKVSIWQGDITKLEIDAIVNAANQSLLGGGGVDGAIHSASGPLLLKECRTLRGCQTGQAKITSGYNLPAKYVIHTVGPTNKSSDLLKSCYMSSLNLMKSHKLKTIAFPCIATGIYGYPNGPAALLALNTVLDFLRSEYGEEVERVIFTLFLDKDVEIYESLLQKSFKNL